VYKILGFFYSTLKQIKTLQERLTVLQKAGISNPKIAEASECLTATYQLILESRADFVKTNKLEEGQ
jgi:pyruvate formate-lyase activating enzyme-like uncharacterized protein